MDDALAEILRRVDKDTIVFFMGDHGMRDVSAELNPGRMGVNKKFKRKNLKV